MHSCPRIFVLLALAMGLLVPPAFAQKPPAPAPPPPASTNPGRTTVPSPLGSQPIEPPGDFVMFLRGRVATDDGTPVPNDVLVERVCNARVRQQVYAAPHGDFSMQLGAMSSTLLDASGDTQDVVANKTPEMGISRHELINRELRASISGFRSDVVNLMDFAPASSNMDVGPIVVHRTEKIKGMTLNAAAYNAPKDARRALEKGIEAEKHGKLADARQYLQKAVEIYPRYTSAWFQLGMVLQKDTQNEAARDAYAKATTIDSKFLPPYLSLASMAYKARDWTQVLSLTNHVLDGDPLRYADVTGYILDLDPLDYAEAYFYNSAANYKFNKRSEE